MKFKNPFKSTNNYDSYDNTIRHYVKKGICRNCGDPCRPVKDEWEAFKQDALCPSCRNNVSDIADTHSFFKGRGVQKMNYDVWLPSDNLAYKKDE